MLKKTIKYTDYNGNERQEDFYFNLNKAELTEMQLSVNGGLDVMLKTIIDANDQPTIMKVFKDLIMKSYGIKHIDGVQFEKSEEISRRFTQTEAYNVLFMELCTDAKAAAAFVKGVLPNDLATELTKEENNK